MWVEDGLLLPFNERKAMSAVTQVTVVLQCLCPELWVIAILWLWSKNVWLTENFPKGRKAWRRKQWQPVLQGDRRVKKLLFLSNPNPRNTPTPNIYQCDTTPTSTPRCQGLFYPPTRSSAMAYSRYSINDYDFYYSKTCSNLAIWSQAFLDC